jgi:protein phosphatase
VSKLEYGDYPSDQLICMLIWERSGHGGQWLKLLFRQGNLNRVRQRRRAGVLPSANAPRKELAMKPSDNRDTAELPIVATPSDALSPTSPSAAVQVDLAAESHPGKVLPKNEDHCLVIRFNRAFQTQLSNLPEGFIPLRAEEVGYAMVVADGMGGRAAGEVASRLAIRTLLNLSLTTPDWIMMKGEPESERVMQRMAERYRRVDAALREEAGADPSLWGMGTTMTLARSVGDELVLAHVGHSRAYLLRGGQLHLLTRDHTLVRELVDLGVVHPEETASHPFRHTLTRVLGGRGDGVEAEVQRVSLADEDQLLLCTDGLTEMVDATTIGAILRSSPSSNDACQRLVAVALQKGGKDNVTVVLARYRFPSKP